MQKLLRETGLFIGELDVCTHTCGNRPARKHVPRPIGSSAAGTARSYLAHLGRQDLLQRTMAGHVLTTKGENRLQFFEVAGCANPDCPRCQGKAGSFTCPTCGWKLQKDHARLKASWETVFFKREAGVFCRVCQAQMFTEDQARLAGIREEENQ